MDQLRPHPDHAGRLDERIAIFDERCATENRRMRIILCIMAASCVGLFVGAMVASA